MPNKQTWNSLDIVAVALACCFVLVIHGAVPFLAVPTLGQAIWSMGWAESFSHNALFDFYAHDFGIPAPAPIAFGLAGAWPASLLIRLGVQAGDAYSTMVAVWLMLAMFSATRIAGLFGATRQISLISAVVWMSMPVISAHAGYSMLSLGIALLPFYFLAALRLFLISPSAVRITPASIALYFAAPIVSVFMDGYTFMMFATGASIFLCHALISRPELRPTLYRVALPVHVASFGVAYFLFSTYIGIPTFEAYDIEFFRAWGLDLSFLAVPTKGISWLSDALGLSVLRSDQRFYGDESVWATTFALPLMLVAIAAWWRIKNAARFSNAVLLVAAFGFYMALGPSLKVNATKAPGASMVSQADPMISPNVSLVPTGNALISHYLPGFKVMRASYRWSALGLFALWLFIVCRVGATDDENKRRWLIVFAVIILFNVPNVRQRWRETTDNRAMFRQIDRDLVAPLHQQVGPGKTAIFVPWGNDFFANYLAPTSGFRTLNIGGDKNVALAQAHWPSGMLALGTINSTNVLEAVKLLVDGTADVIIVPYFHMLWAPHLWPCVDTTTAKVSGARKASYRATTGFICPAERRLQLESTVEALRSAPYAEVVDTALYALVRLRPEFLGAKRAGLIETTYGKINYPLIMGPGLPSAQYFLKKGWYAMEATHVWSGPAAALRLPFSEACMQSACNMLLTFSAFGASRARPVTVTLSSNTNGAIWSQKTVITSAAPVQVRVPVAGSRSGLQDIDIAVPDAISPLALAGAPDGRVLGISLQRIDLSPVK